MGLRGPAPKPTALRVIEGNRSRRPLPKNEPQYEAYKPKRPDTLTPAAGKIWDELVAEMNRVKLLRKVDEYALAQLCEDQALLNEMQAGLQQMAAAFRKQATDQGKELPGPPLLVMMRSTEGRRMMSSIRELSTLVILQRREFGLTPASRTRVSTIGEKTEAQDDPWSQF
jgi:P27 family predicted phage terminase small subunit